jgi:hypothetical protein
MNAEAAEAIAWCIFGCVCVICYTYYKLSRF